MPPSSAKISIRAALFVSLVFGITVAFFDVGLSIAPHPDRLASLPVALLAITTTLVVATALHAVLWAALMIVSGGRVARHLTFVTVFVAVLVAIDLMASIPFKPQALLQWIAIGLIAAASAIGGAFVRRRADESTHAQRWAALFAGTPIFAALIFMFVWLQVYKAGPGTSAASVLALLGFAAAVMGATAVLWRCGTRAAMYAALAVASAIVIGGGLGYASTRPSSRTHDTYADGHAIRHVFLITIDTLRRDALSCYGGTTATPHLDALANDAVVFDHALSASPWTLPAMASIMTGLPPAGHTAIIPTSTLPTSLVTIAERMRDAGYHTGAVVANEYFARDRSMDQGFTAYASYPRKKAFDSTWHKVLSRLMRLYFLNDVSTSDITDMGLRWVDKNREHDFFYWCHYFDPHGPWQPPQAYWPDTQPPAGAGYSFGGIADVRAGVVAPTPEQRDWIKQLYDAEVRYVDAEVGRLLERLKQHGIYDDALIVLTSDHGEEFFEHGNIGHGHSLYNELLGVPLIIKLPRSRQTGRVQPVVPTQAIKTTLLELCGVDDSSPDPNVVSLVPQLLDPFATMEDRPVFSGATCFYENREAVTFAGTKFIRTLDDGEEALYDLGADPAEANNIARTASDRTAIARLLLDDHEVMCGDLRQRFQVFQKSMNLDPETIRRLKALGYL